MSKANPLVPTTAAQLDPRIRSYLELQPDDKLPKIPMATANEIKRQSRDILTAFVTTPGVIGEPLTEQQADRLSAWEVSIYNLAREIKDPECDFEKFKYVSDQLIGPPTQKTESVTMKGDIKDWKEYSKEKHDEIEAKIIEADALESDHTVWD